MPPNGERWAGPATNWLSCSDERDIHAAASRTSSLPVPSWSQCATCLDESLNELVRGRNIRGLLRADACIGNDIGPRQCATRDEIQNERNSELSSTGTGKKTPGGAGTHMGHTGAHGHTDHTEEPHNNPNPDQHTRTTARPRNYRIGTWASEVCGTVPRTHGSLGFLAER